MLPALVSGWPPGLALGQAVEGFFTEVNSDLGPCVNSDSAEGAPTITADGLIFLFASDRPEGVGSWDIWEARRGHVGRPFGDCVNSGPPVNTPSLEGMPSVSGDGLTLYFVRDFELHVAMRSDRESPFGEERPLGVDFTCYCPSVTADGEWVYFGRDDPFGLHDIWLLSLAEGAVAERLAGEVNTEFSEFCPSVSSDELALFVSPRFGFERPGGLGGGDIWVAIREDADDPFGPLVNLGKPVNTPTAEVWPLISPDWPVRGAKLFFTSLRGGAADIHQATWVPAVPFRRGDCNDDGDINLSDAVCILNWLFRGGGAPSCMAVMNLDGAGEVTLTDPVYLLRHLFGGGPAPLAPFSSCGTFDPAAEPGLGCDRPPESCQS